MQRHPNKIRVLIIQKRLPHYRAPFFEKLKAELDKNNIVLELIYGVSHGKSGNRKDEIKLPWGKLSSNREIRIGPVKLLWQPLSKDILKADLVIVEQSSKLILNYILFILYKFNRFKLCLWGHGKNFQESRTKSFGEKVKRLLSRRVFWWFAYTQLSASVVESFGYDKNRITVVQNTLDMRQLINTYENVDKEMIVSVREKLGIFSDNVCIYSGSMYAEKRLSYILEACHTIREYIHDFEMIFIGAGPDETLVENAARTIPWIHYPGPAFGIEKVCFFKLSKLLIMPGSVGLAIIDAFAFETPLVTTDISSHGPEIGYLESGKNGIIWEYGTDSFTFGKKIAGLLENKHLISSLKKGCREAREKYTMEEMVHRFTNGIMSALQSTEN